MVPSVGGSSAPTTPVSQPSTPTPGSEKVEPEPKRKGRRTAKAEEPVTPLLKGREMAGKLLKKKSDAANLALTLQSVPYGDQLCGEMKTFAKDFEILGSLVLYLVLYFALHGSCFHV